MAPRWITYGLLLLVPAFARAEDGDDIVVPEVRVRGVADPDDDLTGESPEADGAERARAEPAFVTVVRVHRRRGEIAPVAEVLAEAVGAHVRSFGGLGSFSSLSLRGAPASQTEILIDGVPLSRVASATVDVGDLDLGTYETVEIHRGGVPVAYGGAALGGAVNFTTALGPDATGRRNTVTIGGGSFGARRTRLIRRDALEDGRLLTAVALGYAGAGGDYAYFDDGGTPLNPDDDDTATRVNNGYDQLDGAARLRWRRGGWLVEAGERLLYKAQGVPGPAGASALHSELATLRELADGRIWRTGAFGQDRLDAGARGWLLVERQGFRDRDGEIGLAAQDRSYLTFAAGTTASASWAVGDRQLFGAAVEGRWEWFRETDHLADEATASGWRGGGALSVTDEIVLGDREQLVLLPALRAELLATRPGSAGMALPGGDDALGHDDAQLSPRVGARWAVTPALSLKANVGRYFRPPTLVELFGDRGFVVGNPSLRAEQGTASDVGLVLAPARRLGAVDRLYMEAAFFSSQAEDLIAFVPSSGRVFVARNLGAARLAGHELAASLRLWRTVTLTGNYTFLDTTQRSELVSYDGKRLPGRPRHEVYARADVARRVTAALELGGYVDVAIDDGNYLDAGNVNRVPARRFLGAGVRAARRGVTVTFEVKNLLDETVEDIPLARSPRPGLDSIPRAVSDVLGYPLPGRALYGAIEWTF